LHHRLLEMGHSQRRTVLLMYGWTAVVAAAALTMAFVPVVFGLGILVVGTLVVATVALRPRWDKSRQARAKQMSRTGS